MSDQETERDSLIAAIESALKASGHAELDVLSDDSDRIKLVRSCGRRAAHDNGWRVQTLAANVGQNTTRIFIMVTSADPMHQRLWDAKRENAMRDAVRRL